MGTRGPSAPRVLRGTAYFLKPPPITQERAGAVLGTAIPAETWAEMERAFDAFDQTMALISGPPAAVPYAQARNRFLRALDTATKHVKDLHDDDVLHEMERDARRAAALDDKLDAELREKLRTAALALVAARRIVRAAGEPRTMKIPTQAQARALLARRLRTVMRGAGLPSALSDRRSLPDAAAEADLTPFERLLSEAEIHVAATPAALAKWAAENTR